MSSSARVISGDDQLKRRSGGRPVVIEQRHDRFRKLGADPLLDFEACGAHYKRWALPHVGIGLNPGFSFSSVRNISEIRHLSEIHLWSIWPYVMFSNISSWENPLGCLLTCVLWTSLSLFSVSSGPWKTSPLLKRQNAESKFWIWVCAATRGRGGRTMG